MIHNLVVAVTLVSGSLAAPVVVDQPPGIVAGTSGRALPAPDRPERPLRLAILPDRTTGRDWGLAYLAMAIDDLNRLSPDAVMSIGDMIQGYTRSVARWDSEAAEFNEMIGQLTAPFYPLAGNHEVVSGTRDASDHTFELRYQETFAPLYYMVEFDLATVIVLYSDDPSFKGGDGIGAVQLSWLETVLSDASSRLRPILVLLHRPLWRSRRSRWIESVHPLLVEHGVSAVIAGHFHTLQRDRDRDGIEYHIVGTCGGMIDQHPLTGQLQHLTFLTISSTGDVQIYHQPVGMTLPDDFVVREDQDRIFRLKTNPDVVRFLDAPDDPVGGPVDQVVRVRLSNPLDVSIRVETSLVTEPPEAVGWRGSYWVTNFESDRFNPHVTDVNTQFTLDPPAAVSLEAGSTRVVELVIRCPQLERAPSPPEFHFTAHLEDSKGREVPVVVRRRLPLIRQLDPTVSVPTSWWAVCAWEFSVYETLEPNPEVRLRLTESELSIDLRVPDACRSGWPVEPADLAVHSVNPQSDAVMVTVSQGSVEHVLYVAPFVETTLWRLVGKQATKCEAVVRLGNAENDGVIWHVTLAIPWSDLKGIDPSRPFRMNVAVADNDETYHTQWRRLAPVGRPAVVAGMSRKPG